MKFKYCKKSILPLKLLRKFLLECKMIMSKIIFRTLYSKRQSILLTTQR